LSLDGRRKGENGNDVGGGGPVVVDAMAGAGAAAALDTPLADEPVRTPLATDRLVPLAAAGALRGGTDPAGAPAGSRARAAAASIRPLPPPETGWAVASRAWITSARLRPGFSPKRRAAVPETCGAAIEVPSIRPY
jgi:hypothetical protein